MDFSQLSFRAAVASFVAAIFLIGFLKWKQATFAPKIEDEKKQKVVNSTRKEDDKLKNIVNEICRARGNFKGIAEAERFVEAKTGRKVKFDKIPSSMNLLFVILTISREDQMNAQKEETVETEKESEVVEETEVLPEKKEEVFSEISFKKKKKNKCASNDDENCEVV